jgi:phospholipase C
MITKPKPIHLHYIYCVSVGLAILYVIYLFGPLLNPVFNGAFALVSDSELAPKSKTPINHIIVLSQGKRSFDNYFGTYPGVNGYPANLTIPLNPFAQPISQFTIGVWFNTNNTFSKDGFIINKGGVGVDTPGKNLNYGIWMNKSGNIHAGFETKDGVDYTVVSDKDYNNGKWHSIFVTYDGNNLYLFVNGQLTARNQTDGAIPDTSGIQPIRIGSNSLNPSNYYSGLVDEVRIWNRPLPSTEISIGYKNNTYDTDGQLVYLSFEDDRGGNRDSETTVSSNELDGMYLNGSSYRDVEYNTKQYTPYFTPFPLKQTQTKAPEDGSLVYKTSYNNGAMNGFLFAQNINGKDPNLVMGYYDNKQLRFYWQLASEFVLADNFFAPSMETGLANHQYLYTASSGDYKKNASFSRLIDLNTTIFDKLQEKGYPWKVYVEDYDPTLNYTNNENRKNRFLYLLSSVPRFVDNKTLSSNIVDLVGYFRDLRNDSFPAVSYIVAPESDDTSPRSVLEGQKFVSTLILSLMKSKHWNDSVFILTYREPGGWYDHVKPPIINNEKYGFRVPALIISPYAKNGYIDSTIYDVTSILKFIEYNYDLGPLSKRDASADNLLNAFDFTSGPRETSYNASALAIYKPRTDTVITSENTSTIYHLYLIIIPLIIAIGLIIWRFTGASLFRIQKRI